MDNPEFEVKVHIRKKKRPIVSVYRLIEDEEIQQEDEEKAVEEKIADMEKKE